MTQGIIGFVFPENLPRPRLLTETTHSNLNKSFNLVNNSLSLIGFLFTNIISSLFITYKGNTLLVDMKFGLTRVAAAIPKVTVGNVKENLERIKVLCKKADENNVDFIVFPELCLTGYTCGDLFHQRVLLERVDEAVCELKKFIKGLDSGMVVIIGVPILEGTRLINSALVLCNQVEIGTVGKKNLPGYKEFYEPRWFAPSTDEPKVFESGGVNFGIEICEDLWSPEPPSVNLVKRGADLVFNLSASNELIGKHDYLVRLLEQQSARLICGYVYCSAGYGESSQDLVYAGNGIILENGKILAKSERFRMEEQLIMQDIDVEALRNERMVNTSFRSFSEAKKVEEHIPDWDSDTIRRWNAYPFKADDSRCKEILEIQSHALAKRLEHTGLRPVIGVSGGSDSTWALIVICRALEKLGRPFNDCLGVSMPGFATSRRTRDNAKRLMEVLGIEARELNITGICEAELKVLGHPIEVQDVTFENVQARTRTQILMNLANQEGGLVIGTGDLSELALGWCTYNADHMSMYGVNVSVPKTLVKRLIKWYSESESGHQEVLKDILETPVSPELTGTGADGEEAQVTEDLIGPYELHDFFLYHTLRHGFSPEKILFLAEHSDLIKIWTPEDMRKWMKVFVKRFFTQQFKRSCLPDGPKIGSVSLSPRGDWRMPSDATWKTWI